MIKDLHIDSGAETRDSIICFIMKENTVYVLMKNNVCHYNKARIVTGNLVNFWATKAQVIIN